MARTLTRPSLYDEDYVAWTEEQAALLRAGRVRELDLANIAEELEDMGRSEWRELENRLEVLLMHLLTYDHQPQRRSRSWNDAIREQRNGLRRLIKRNPGLKRDLEAVVADVYGDAVGRAAEQTGPDPATFPRRVPYTIEQILQPEPVSGRQGRRGGS